MDDEFPVKEIPIIYSLSMRLQTNEIYKDNHINMRFPEFLEAFSRFVDKLSPAPPGRNDMKRESRDEQLLATKLENIMPSFFKLITDNKYKYIKDRFPTLTKDMETGLFEIDYNNPLYKDLLPPPPQKKPKRKSISTNNDIINDNINENVEEKNNENNNENINENINENTNENVDKKNNENINETVNENINENNNENINENKD